MALLESTALTVSWQNAVATAGAVFSGLVALLLKAAGNKVDSVEKSVALTHSQLETMEVSVVEQGNRLSVIEASYVKREDLEAVVFSLQEDLKRSFDRAHTRIDELYSRPGGSNE